MGCIPREAWFVGSVSDSRGGGVEFALDSDVHACNRRDLLSQYCARISRICARFVFRIRRKVADNEQVRHVLLLCAE